MRVKVGGGGGASVSKRTEQSVTPTSKFTSAVIDAVSKMILRFGHSTNKMCGWLVGHLSQFSFTFS